MGWVGGIRTIELILSNGERNREIEKEMNQDCREGGSFSR